MNRGRAPKIKSGPKLPGRGRTRRPPLHKPDSRGGCPYVCDNVQKKIVIWAVTVTPP
jgi:hypothetical protein